MTPYDMARDECANWIPSLGCIGTLNGKCLLASQKACSYFRDSVLPLAAKYRRYGVVVQQFNGMVERRRKDRRKDNEAALDALGRQARTDRPCGKCINCLNLLPALCLSTAPRALQEQEHAAPESVRLVLDYCRKCKVPLYVPHARYCDKCRLVSKREHQRAADRKRRGRHAMSLTPKPIDSIDRKMAGTGVLALQRTEGGFGPQTVGSGG